MKERPILMSAPMVRAVLAGTKTQTRRTAKPGRNPSLLDGSWSDEYVLDPGNREWLMRDCPYGQPGDRLWVRETWAYYGGDEYLYQQDRGSVAYRAGGSGPLVVEGIDPIPGGRWRPSIHMPRWASRILLEVTDIRVERLQGISERDAVAEGVTPFYCGPAHDVKNPTRWGVENPPLFDTPADAYQHLWEQINGAGLWYANPWVWVIDFRRGDHA